jgi:DNA-directed RNA polymerase II subunit RPB1
MQDCINALQMHLATYLDNSSVPQQVTSQRGGRVTKSLKQRLEKKDGRVRGNLMGKRVNFTARTVITPDPNLELDEIGIPWKDVARHLTFPEPVNQINIKDLTERVKVGPDGKFQLSQFKKN